MRESRKRREERGERRVRIGKMMARRGRGERWDPVSCPAGSVGTTRALGS
jgi:hypothetical protein